MEFHDLLYGDYLRFFTDYPASKSGLNVGLKFQKIHFVEGYCADYTIVESNNNFILFVWYIMSKALICNNII